MRIGLHEREREVKAAAEKLILAWLTAVSVGEKKDVMEDLFAFLKLFDLTESKTAEEALTSVFKTKPEIVNEIQTDGAFRSSSILLTLRCSPRHYRCILGGP